MKKILLLVITLSINNFCYSQGTIESLGKSFGFPFWITIGLSAVAIIISCFFSSRQKKQLNKQDEILNKQDDTLKLHNEQLKNSIEKIEKVYQNLRTRDTPDFPKNIDMIIEEIFDFCIDKKFSLEIYTDVGGYAILSNNMLWRKYYERINKCMTSDVDIFWCFYDDDLQVKQRESQFKEYEGGNNVDKLRQKVLEYKQNVKIYDTCESKDKGCLRRDGGECRADKDKELECVPIMKLEDSYDSLVETLRELQRITNENVERLLKRGSVKKIKRLSSELPFFAWFAIKKEDNKKIPIKGIISYNVLNGNIIEKGLLTENRELLSVLYDIIQYNIESKLNSEKRDDKEDKNILYDKSTEPPTNR